MTKPKAKPKAFDNTVSNYYLKLPKKYANKAHNPNYENHLLNIPLRMLLIGPSGSGKNNAVMELLKRFGPTFHKIIICCRNRAQPFYEMLEEKNPDVIEFHDIESGADIPDIENNKDQKLIIFDDCLALKDQSKIKDYFIRGRHNNYNCLYLTQSYYSSNKDYKTFRIQCNYIMILKVNSLKDLNLIMKDFPLNKTKDELWDCYHKATKEKMDFLLVDVDKEQVRHNFFEIL